MRFLLLPLVTALIMAGCIGDDAPSDELEPTGAAVDDAPPNATADTTTNDATDAVQESLLVEVHEEASTSTGVTVCPPGRNHCVSAPTWPEFYKELETAPAHLDEVSLTLSWEPASRMTEQLTFALYGCDDDGCVILGDATAASPIVVDVAAETGPFHTYGLSVSAPNVSPAGPGVYAAPDQPFVLTGHLTVTPLAPT